MKDLRKILYPVLIFEAAIALYLGGISFIAWMSAFLWTVLMLKEFFIPAYLNKRIGLYLLSHQILVPLMIAIPLSLRLKNTILHSYEIASLILMVTGAMCFTVTYELGRKTWSKEKENIYADSYTREWGIKKTVATTQVISFIGTAIYSWLMYEIEISNIYIIINWVFFILMTSAELIFYKKQTTNNSKIVEIAGAVYMLGTFMNTALAFTRYLS